MKKKETIGIKKTITNNIYAIKLLFQASPGIIIWRVASNAINSIIYILDLYFLRFAVNLAQTDGNYKKVFTILFILCGIYSIHISLNTIISSKLEPKFTTELEENLKTILLKKAKSCDLSCFENTEFYKNYTLAMENCLPKLLSVLQSVSDLISAIISLIFAGILSFIIDPVLFVFSLLPFSLLFLHKIKNTINYKMSEENTDISRKKGYVTKTFFKDSYIKEMKTSQIHIPIFTMLKNSMKECANIHKKYGTKVALIWVLEMTLNSFFSQYIILGYAAWNTIVTGNMLYGDCLVIISTSRSIYESINSIVNSSMAFHENAFYIESILKFLNYKTKITDNSELSKATFGNIELKNVSFRYDNSSDYILKNVCLEIKAGEKIAIVGENGAGKSTLIKLLMRLYDPTQGEITLSGTNLKELNLFSLRNLFSHVFQDSYFFPLSIKDNICLGDTSITEDKLINAIEKSNLSNHMKKMNCDINTMVGRELYENGVVFSGGQLRSLSIARMFAKDAEIIILDEPSSSLDPISESEMYKEILRNSEKKTLISISHRLSVSTDFDKIIVLDKGEVVEEGNHRELMKKKGKYFKIFKAQANTYIEGMENYEEQ